MKKRILIYFNSLKPSGGIERVIATLSGKLSEKYAVTVLVKDDAVSFYDLDPRVKLISLESPLNFNMKSKVSRFFSAIKTIVNTNKVLRNFLRQHNFDYYYLAHPLNVLEFALAKGVNNKNVILTEHGSQTAYNSFYKTIKRVLYPKCKIYVVPTTADTEMYQKVGFPAQYIPHFRSALPYQMTQRENNILLSIGRFTEVKQQSLLLNIWKDIITKHQVRQWKLLLVGQGELEGELKSFIAKHELSEYIEILPPIKNIETYYLRASAFVLTSSSEGFGMVLLEAISFGLPCVSFDCPSGPRDMIINNSNGYLVPLGDIDGFETALLNLIRDPALINTMGDNAFHFSEAWKDENVLKKWVEILD